MKKKLLFSIALFVGFVLLLFLAAPASHAQSIEAAEIISVTCDGFTIGTISDLGIIDYKFELQRTNPPGPVVLVSGSFPQTVAKPDVQTVFIPWSDFPAIPYVLADGTLDPGDYVIVNSPLDDPGRTATLRGFNTILLHYSAGPIVCEETGGEGCTPGYWKQQHHFDSWTGWVPGDLFDTVFGVNAFPGKTLLQALKQGGGGKYALGRHAVAALLNASSADVSYQYSVGEVINIVHDAFTTGNYETAKDLLEKANETICPLN